MNKTLKYISPAKSFTEALPLGNGSLGAMVYGGVPEEKITLNYDTFWSGTGHREEKEIDSSTLEQARKLIFEEKFWEAEEYMKKNMLGFYNESYMPLGILSYPSLRGSVLFCLDWLQQREDGLYYTAPSTSPENTFKDGEGHACGVSYMTTMDLAIIKCLRCD